MKVVNKWNKSIYIVIKEEGTLVTLKREDGSMFTITRSEFHSAYNKLND